MELELVINELIIDEDSGVQADGLVRDLKSQLVEMLSQGSGFKSGTKGNLNLAGSHAPSEVSGAIVSSIQGAVQP